ncbi:MAG: hypothetical protein MK137_08135 [Rickettsiales bacterium]|nr:hypothetical protein [Rickettsiales bacterium]
MAEIVWLPPIKSHDARPIVLLDVMQYFLQWKTREEPLFRSLHSSENITYEWITKLFSEYHLAPSFPTKNRASAEDQEQLTSMMNDFYKSYHSIDHVAVLAHKLEPFTTYGKGKTRNPMKAASILLWYFNRYDVCIYDSESKKSISRLMKLESAHLSGIDLMISSNLEADFDREEEDLEEMEEMDLHIEMEIPLDMESYFDFHQCWIDMYLDRVAEIHHLCNNLYQLCIEEKLPLYHDCDCLLEEWFFRRVFSTWLHNIQNKLEKHR